MGYRHTVTTPSTQIVDFSASTGVVYTFDAPKAGKLVLDQCYGTAEEAIGDATTQGVMIIQVNDVTVATYTTIGTEAIGDKLNFTVDGTVATATNPVAYFTAGQKIDVELSVQASGATTTGTARVYLAMELAD